MGLLVEGYEGEECWDVESGRRKRCSMCQGLGNGKEEGLIGEGTRLNIGLETPLGSIR